MEPITTTEAFIYGMAGAFFTYLVIFRAQRLLYVISDFSENWKMIVFDFLIYGNDVTQEMFAWGNLDFAPLQNFCFRSMQYFPTPGFT